MLLARGRRAARLAGRVRVAVRRLGDRLGRRRDRAAVRQARRGRPAGDDDASCRSGRFSRRLRCSICSPSRGSSCTSGSRRMSAARWYRRVVGGQAAEQIIAGVVLSERLAVTMYGAIHRAQFAGQRNLRGLVVDPKMLEEDAFRHRADRREDDRDGDPARAPEHRPDRRGRVGRSRRRDRHARRRSLRHRAGPDHRGEGEDEAGRQAVDAGRRPDRPQR